MSEMAASQGVTTGISPVIAIGGLSGIARLLFYAAVPVPTRPNPGLAWAAMLQSGAWLEKLTTRKPS